MDANSGVYRYTFDLVHLSDGIEFVVVVIALFAVSEMLEMLEKVVAGHSVEVKPSGRKLFNLKSWHSPGGAWCAAPSSASAWACCRGRAPAWPRPWPIRRKSASSRQDPDAKFGKGDMRGLVAPRRRPRLGVGSFVPMLTLGVPGSGTTAVMMGR